jgi:hypothetical protein
MNNIKITTILIILTSCFALSCSNDNGDSINDIYLDIPDIHFETILIEQGIDTDGIVNQQMLKSDAKEVSQLNLNLSANFGQITDMKGIEGFTNITLLSAAGQKLEKIDLSSNTLLETLTLTGNFISSIDLSNNTNLIFVEIQSNLLTSVTGLSNAANLKELDLSWNYFKEFTIDSESLEFLDMRINDLTSINVNSAINLKTIILRSNQLTSIDISNNTLLEFLVIPNNLIEAINIEKNTSLTHLSLFENALSKLDLTNNQNLVDLKVDRNPSLTCINIATGQNIPTVSKSDYQELNSNCN